VIVQKNMYVNFGDFFGKQMLQNSCEICNIMVFDRHFVFENHHKTSAQPASKTVFLSVLRDCDNKTFFGNFCEFFKKEILQNACQICNIIVF